MTRSAPRPAAGRRAQAYAAVAAVLKVISARPEPAGRQEPWQWLWRKRGGRD